MVTLGVELVGKDENLSGTELNTIAASLASVANNLQLTEGCGFLVNVEWQAPELHLSSTVPNQRKISAKCLR